MRNVSIFRDVLACMILATLFCPGSDTTSGMNEKDCRIGAHPS